jgi:hypothetical protein
VASQVTPEEKALYRDLAAVGFTVDALEDLRDSGVKYHAAVPVLLDRLERTDDPLFGERIVRALSVPWAKKLALEPLIGKFRTIPLQRSDGDELLRWAVGNALDVLWDDAYFDDLAKLATDQKFGKAREMVTLGLGRSRLTERAGDLLILLLEDPIVYGHAAAALRKIQYEKAREPLKRLLDDDRAWVRKEAMGALKKLDEG